MLYCWFLTCKMRFDTTVRAITDPAGNAELMGLLLSPGAKEHSLYAAGYADMASYARHHTVAMSGASSAFMPTTL